MVWPRGPEFGSARARLVSPAQASLPRSWPTPELRIPNAVAQTRIVSKARIRMDSGKSVGSFKGIICVDISEFESYMPRQAVRSPPAQNGTGPPMPIVRRSRKYRAIIGRRCEAYAPLTSGYNGLVGGSNPLGPTTQSCATGGRATAIRPRPYSFIRRPG